MYWSLSLKFSGVPDSSTAFAKALRLWNHARERLQAIETAIVANLMPTGTALFALLIVGETVSPNVQVGMILTHFGVALVALQ
jgi:drug/metabolite transporter (DMT)-like permease